MQDFPPFGRELTEAQEQLEQVLARCVIRLKPFGGAANANDNALFPGVRVPGDEARSGPDESAHEQTG